MNNGRSQSVLIIVFAAIVMLYLVMSVLLTGGNAIGYIFKYLVVLAWLIGMVSPRFAMRMFVVECACLDLCKRLMIVDGSVFSQDLYWVLGVAPVTVAGILIGIIARIVNGRLKGTSNDLLRFGVAVAVTCLSGLLEVKRGGGMMQVLREGVDGGFYWSLLFVIPMIYKTEGEMRRLLNFCLWIFVPVALYGIYQQVFGYQSFEIEYLKSGLTIEIKQLQEGRIRAFGTLNSPTSLSLISGELLAMALLIGFQGLALRRRYLHPMTILMMICVYFGAWLATTVRVGILAVPLGLAGYYAFTSLRRTIAFYAVCCSAFIVLVASSGFLLENIETWTQELTSWAGGGEYLERMLVMNTYKDRLYGFKNVLANPKAYSLFGLNNADTTGEFYNHDPLSATLIGLGVIPMLVMLAVLFVGLLILHRSVLGVREPSLRALAAACLAVAFGAVGVSMVGGNLMTTFPSNAFFCIFIGITSALPEVQRRLQRESGRDPKQSFRSGAGYVPMALNR